MDQCGAFVNEPCVNLHHIGTRFYFADGIVATEDAAHANDGKLWAEVLAQQSNDAVATCQHGRARQAARFITMRHAFHGISRQSGVGCNHAIHLVFDKTLGNDSDLRIVQVGGYFEKDGHAFLMGVCQCHFAFVQG